MQRRTTFEFSDDTKDLLAALAAFQMDSEVIRTNEEAKAGKYNYKYASFAQIVNSTREARGKHGIGYTFLPSDAGPLTCRVFHASSGQWMQGQLMIELSERGAQAVGSQMSYAKRYLLTLMLGLAIDDEDDDGAAANNAGPKAPEPGQKVTQFEITRDLEHRVAICEEHELLERIFNEDVPKFARKQEDIVRMFRAARERITKAQKATVNDHRQGGGKP